VRCDYAINEGAGDRVQLGGSTFYECTTAEKLTAPFRILVKGRSGHASMPSIADNALIKAATLIDRIAAFAPEQEVQQEVEAFARAVLGELPATADLVDRVRALDEITGELVRALLSPTFSPTIISASQKRNVIPALVELEVDCRLLPGQTPEQIEPVVRRMLGNDVEYDLVFGEAQGGTRSALDTPLWDAVESFVAAIEPGARPVPLACAGFTDSHWLREAFGTVAYGFFPMRTMPAEVSATLIHSADERIPVADLELGVEWMRHAARALLG
jgi:acetylornithine deacetylase/succinyl-diaminopimelate desuccinylase-like protein